MTSYKKAIDLDGEAVALIHYETAEKIITLSPVVVAGKEKFEVDIRQFSSETEMKAYIPVRIVDCSDEDWNTTLFGLWGFDGSSVYRAPSGAQQEDAVSEPETQPDQTEA